MLLSSSTLLLLLIFCCLRKILILLIWWSYCCFWDDVDAAIERVCWFFPLAGFVAVWIWRRVCFGMLLLMLCCLMCSACATHFDIHPTEVKTGLSSFDHPADSKLPVSHCHRTLFLHESSSPRKRGSKFWNLIRARYNSFIPHPKTTPPQVRIAGPLSCSSSDHHHPRFCHPA